MICAMGGKNLSTCALVRRRKYGRIFSCSFGRLVAFSSAYSSSSLAALCAVSTNCSRLKSSRLLFCRGVPVRSSRKGKLIDLRAR
ncbi:hypothetical protein HYQ46_005424 [Verticillium longisporum]|nr:hypothetical protein HYQ46_005424 [Verticillium longisporum]